MFTYLIDGYNLLYQIREFRTENSEELEHQRNRLIKRLIGFSAGRHFDFHLVFDSSRAKHGRTRFPGVLIEYASPSADALIRDIISGNQGSKILIVVTSDRKDIGNYAKLCSLKWMTSQQFWKKMISLQSVPRADPPESDCEGEAPTEWTSEDDAWLRRAFEE